MPKTAAAPKARPLPELFNVQQTCELLATSKRHLYRLVAERRLPRQMVGGRLRFRKEDIEKFLRDGYRPLEEDGHGRARG